MCPDDVDSARGNLFGGRDMASMWRPDGVQMDANSGGGANSWLSGCDASGFGSSTMQWIRTSPPFPSSMRRTCQWSMNIAERTDRFNRNANLDALGRSDDEDRASSTADSATCRPLPRCQSHYPDGTKSRKSCPGTRFGSQSVTKWCCDRLARTSPLKPNQRCGST